MASKVGDGKECREQKTLMKKWKGYSHGRAECLVEQVEFDKVRDDLVFVYSSLRNETS